MKLSFVKNKILFMRLGLLLLFIAVTQIVGAQQLQTLSIPSDSPRWLLEGQAKPAEYLGRLCLYVDGGAATLKDLVLRDGVIDVDVATPANRGFFGIQFRIENDTNNELMLAVSELSGGWGFICRLADRESQAQSQK